MKTYFIFVAFEIITLEMRPVVAVKNWENQLYPVKCKSDQGFCNFQNIWEMNIYCKSYNALRDRQADTVVTLRGHCLIFEWNLKVSLPKNFKNLFLQEPLFGA